MPIKPPLTNKALEKIMKLSLLVGRFSKMQQHDITGSDAPLAGFELADWEMGRNFRKKLELYAEYYPPVKEYINQMNQILEIQANYRKEHPQEIEEHIKRLWGREIYGLQRSE